jgi:hypothetical protein
VSIFGGGLAEVCHETEEVIYLLGDHFGSFPALIDFLYHGTIPTDHAGNLPEDLDRLSAHEVKLCKMYFMAEKLEVEDYMNRIVDELHGHHYRYNLTIRTCKVIRDIYKNTAKESMLQAYAAAKLAYAMTSQGYEKEVFSEIASLCKEVSEFA